MSYRVKEIFYTLQGEGAHAGRPAVLCRFIGCNLWSGHEQDRANAICCFCDTDFRAHAGDESRRFADPAELTRAIELAWPADRAERYVVLTGGSPPCSSTPRCSTRSTRVISRSRSRPTARSRSRTALTGSV